MYFYEDLNEGTSVVVPTLSQLSERTGKSTRKISETLREFGKMYDVGGRWRIVPTVSEKAVSKHRPGSEFNFLNVKK